MLKMNFCKFFLMFVVANMFLFNLNAQVNIIPQLDFGMLQIENNSFLYSPSGCFQFKYKKDEDSDEKGPDVIAGSLSYGQDIFSKNVSWNHENNFHKLGVFGKLVSGKNTFLLKLDDRGANPFECYKTLEGLLFYARKIIDTKTVQLDVGGGLAATDTGIVLGGIDIFIVPLPMIHFSYKNQIIDAEIEWIGMPDAIITLFPQSMFKIRSSFALAGFDLPVDLQGDFALYCYPFREGFLKDLASISLGVSHEVKKFRINTENSFKYDYFTAYGQISITALTIRSGYAFGGRKTVRAKDIKEKSDYKGGFFATVQAMYKF